jgi:hypothetical protein
MLSDFYGTVRHRFLVEPFGSRPMENKFTLDLRVEKGIEVGNYGRLAAIVDVFNITNSNPVIRRNTDIVDGAFQPNAEFNQIQEVLASREVRFGLRYSF